MVPALRFNHYLNVHIHKLELLELICATYSTRINLFLTQVVELICATYYTTSTFFELLELELSFSYYLLIKPQTIKQQQINSQSLSQSVQFAFATVTPFTLAEEEKNL
jgi:hypothetical protein